MDISEPKVSAIRIISQDLSCAPPYSAEHEESVKPGLEMRYSCKFCIATLKTDLVD